MTQRWMFKYYEELGYSERSITHKLVMENQALRRCT